MKLWHFSPRKVKTVDPRHYGSNPWTSAVEVVRATKRRAFFYRAGSQPEGMVVRGSQFLHVAEADLKLYNIGRDPLRVTRHDDWERQLHGMGYQGFYNSKLRGPLRNAVAVWEPVPVQGVYKLL